MRSALSRVSSALSIVDAAWGARGVSTIGEGIIEIRDYTVKPEYFTEYIDENAVSSDVRLKHMPFLGMFTPETGSVLNRTVHMYAYTDMEEREQTRSAMLDRSQWSEFLRRARPYVIGPQVSIIFREAAPLYAALGMKPTKEFVVPDDGSAAIYEMREYQLHPGYDTVPTVVKALQAGLPHKVAASPHGTPVFFGFTEIGTLNTFVEIWRYQTSQGCMDGRAAARKSPEWSKAVATVAPLVQSFRCELLRPLWFSPWH